MMRNKIIAIVGSTASGKTNLSLLLAQVFPLEVVSCDSVQVYRELNIGSAKPSPAELAQVPHHLIDCLSPDDRISAARYKEMAESAVKDILTRGKIPVVVGGTGMYFNSLYYGMFEGETTNSDIRKELKKSIEKEGVQVYFEKLRKVDPSYAEKIASTDARRIVRALEAFEVTGMPFSELHTKNKKLDLNWLLLGMDLDRTKLYDKINGRVEQMIEAGLVEETEALIRKYGWELVSLESLGYRHCRDYLRGNIDFDQMVSDLKRDTRRFAKRQLTWFRKNKEILWVSSDAVDQVIAVVRDFLNIDLESAVL